MESELTFAFGRLLSRVQGTQLIHTTTRSTTMLFSIQRITAALSIACTLSTAISIDKNMINFQSGIDLGSTFAGGMTYDKQHNRLFLTGSTYARGFFQPEATTLDFDGEINSDCFFVAIELADESDPESIAQWKQPTRLGYVKDPEACSMVHYREDHDRVFLGASASGESMGRTDLEGDILPQADDGTLFGEVISLSLDHVYGRAPIIPQHYIFGGHGFYQSEVNYPFAITSASMSQDEDEEGKNLNEKPIYVASLYSKFTGQWDEDFDADEIDLSSPYIEGNVWGIAIQKININHSNATNMASILENPTHMQRVWSKKYETTDYQKLQATDMVFVNGNLLLVGSTYDFGEQFAGEQRQYRNYQDYDGFLVKLDPETGDIATSIDEEEMMKLRIQSGFEQDDIIQSICLHPEDKDGYVPYVYVVGSIESHEHHGEDVNVHREDESENEDEHEEHEEHDSCYGFVKKIDLRTMTVMWEDEIHGGHVKAIDCAVTEDGGTLYVTGTTENGGALEGWENNGGDDIWVRQYGTMGDARWEIQAGTEEDESLAKGGAIVIDSANNAIIYGNTRGSMGRVRDDKLEIPDATNDIFVMTVSYEGAYLAPQDNPIFQIPRFYLEDSAHQHKPLIVGMFLVAMAVFVIVMGCESKWKRVPVIDFLSDVMPTFPNKRLTNDGEDTALTVQRVGEVVMKPVDMTEGESESEDDSFSDDAAMAWLYNKPQPSTQRRERDTEEEKTEMA